MFILILPSVVFKYLGFIFSLCCYYLEVKNHLLFFMCWSSPQSFPTQCSLESKWDTSVVAILHIYLYCIIKASKHIFHRTSLLESYWSLRGFIKTIKLISCSGFGCLIKVLVPSHESKLYLERAKTEFTVAINLYYLSNDMILRQVEQDNISHSLEGL